MARIAKALFIAGLCATPLVVHLALWLSWPPLVTALVVGVQLSVVAAALLARSSLKHKLILALAVAGLFVTLVWQLGANALTVSSGLPHAALHLTLLGLFGASLQPGREPLVTGIIKRVRGPIPPELVAYGRHLTIAWCLFFGAQLAISLTLLLTTPLAVWSFFVNVVSLPMVLLMFVAEFVYRSVRFRHLPRSRIADMIGAVIRLRTGKMV